MNSHRTPQEAILYEKLPGSRVRCRVCQWECSIGPEKFGVCRVRQNVDGKLFVLNYGRVSSVAADPIEKKPLFHFYPKSTVFSLGGWGCNFHCKHCQNWQISSVDPMESLRGGQYLSPHAAIDLAQQSGCDGIAWTYNEPGIWLEYTLDSAKIAKERNLYTVYVTNGYITEQALDAIGPYLDAFRVDFKGFSDQLYRDLAKVHRWRGILDVTKRAQDKWGMHVEVITNIIPTINDDEEQLTAIATWIKDNLGELTPWHITRFHPHYQMQHLPSTPVESLEQAYQIGRRAGLHFVYTGNVPGNERENTRCYACGAEAVRRFGYETHLIGLTDGMCSTCGTDLNFKTPSWQRSFAEKARGR